jgi:hypothetical protein
VRQDPISQALNLFKAIHKKEYMMSKQIKESECEAIGGGMIIKSWSRRGEVFLLGFNGVPDAARCSVSDEGSDRPATGFWGRWSHRSGI